MSDYEVTLVNDSMQEFYVWFYGPTESAQSHDIRATSTRTHERGAHLAPFSGGIWKIHVELPDQYPFKSPSIGFMNKIFHPNIDELYGCIRTCSGVTLTSSKHPGVAPFVWMLLTRRGHRCSVSRSPPSNIVVFHPTFHVIDMINIFEVFLPQLLRYPNPSDPLNGEAAALLMRHPKEYEQRVKGADHTILVLLWLTSKHVEYVQRYATKEAANKTSADDEEEADAEMSDMGSISAGEE